MFNDKPLHSTIDNPSAVTQSDLINTSSDTNKLTEFRQSPLYQLMVGNDINSEELEIIKQLATGYLCNVYSKDGQRFINLSVKSIPSESNRRGGQIAIELHDCYDERLSSSVDIRHISDVFIGNQIFPYSSQKIKTNCFSLRCKNQMDVHILMISQEIRDRWVKGLHLIYQFLAKSKIASVATRIPDNVNTTTRIPDNVTTTTRIPDNVTIPPTLYNDLVTHVQQMNLKFAQITHAMNQSKF